MVSVDTPEDNKKFAEKNNANFPILSDPKRVMTSAYGVLSESNRAKRWTFYIDKEGVIKRIDKNVKPRSAGDDLLKNLLQLKVKRT